MKFAVHIDVFMFLRQEQKKKPELKGEIGGENFMISG
jgi:hypothetical protein